MFTGIIEETGKILSIEQSSNSQSLKVECSFVKELAIGESVAVNGICLTVTKKDDNAFFADVTPETLKRTSLENIEVGSIVNLERAMKLDSRFGGHIVSGHIDGTGILEKTEKDENAVNISVKVPEKIACHIIEKGSICIDGISLTVADICKSTGDDYSFSVAIIPHTWNNTNLCKRNIGDKLNIECDVISKYIAHHMNNPLGFDCATEDDISEAEQKLIDLLGGFKSFH